MAEVIVEFIFGIIIVIVVVFVGSPIIWGFDHIFDQLMGIYRSRKTGKQVYQVKLTGDDIHLLRAVLSHSFTSDFSLRNCDIRNLYIYFDEFIFDNKVRSTSDDDEDIKKRQGRERW